MKTFKSDATTEKYFSLFYIKGNLLMIHMEIQIHYWKG